MPVGIELKLGNDWLNMEEVYKTNGWKYRNTSIVGHY
jgi:hypothetical protein